ncbi:hypothetical protein QL285_018570 [Trifolium repens]|nr:hypothetical protein QL285_018570 [Trifolium repens]
MLFWYCLFLHFFLSSAHLDTVARFEQISGCLGICRIESQKRISDLILHLTSSSFNFYLMNIFSLFLQIWWKKIVVEELELGKHRIGRRWFTFV